MPINTGNVAAVTGTFDGVHRGHRYLIGRLRDLAAGRSCAVVRAYTFDRHPLEVIAPAKAPLLLTPTERKVELLRRAGADDVSVDRFADIRSLTAAEYIARLASQGVTLLMIGHDSRFGSDRPSSLADYVEAARGTGVEIVRGPELTDPSGHPINSSTIRTLIAAGDMATANSLLGYTYSITGRVEAGKQLGRTIGFPTANLHPDADRQLIPSRGVYAALAAIDGTTAELPAMVNIGHRPTVDAPDAPDTVEAHIIGYDGDLYGRPMSLHFVERLRSERRFPNIDALRRQLVIDRDAALKTIKSAQPTF